VVVFVLLKRGYAMPANAHHDKSEETVFKLGVHDLLC